MSPTRPHPSDRPRGPGLYSYALFAAVVWGALSFGAVYPWAYWPLTAVAAGLGVWGLARKSSEPRSGPLAYGLATVAVAIAIQIVPLPYAVFLRVAGAGDRFFRQYQIGYEMNVPAWHALSLDPNSTAIVLALFAGLSLLLLGLSRVVNRLVRLDWLVSRLAGFGVGLAVFGAVQKSFDYGGHHALVYGFWEPSHFGNPFGPFINRNHFAGWMVLTLPLAMGYACAAIEISRRPRGRDWGRWARWIATPDASRFLLWAFCVFAMGVSLALTTSRSGMGSFAVAVVVLAYFVSLRVGGRLGRSLAIGVALALVAGVVAWAGIGSTAARFSMSLAASDVPGRWTAWRDTLRMFADFPVFGTGLGTYGLAMLVYQSGVRDAIYFQAHNDYLQLLSEGGLLVAVPAVVTVAILVRAIRRRLADGEADPVTYWIRAGAVAGLCGMAAQSTLEFSLQIPGITFLFVVVAAIAMHRSVAPHAHRV